MIGRKFKSARARTSYVRYDIFVNALLGFVALTALLWLYINPPAKEATKDDFVPPGNVIVEIVWPDSINADVDLWVVAPGDMPVGWSNLGGVIFNLLRDDRGTNIDVTGINYENAYSRGIVEGEYVVNVHWYNNFSDAKTIPVTVALSVKKPPKSLVDGGKHEVITQILKTEVKLRHVGEEITATRFKLTEEGKLVSGSVNALFKPIVTAK